MRFLAYIDDERENYYGYYHSINAPSFIEAVKLIEKNPEKNKSLMSIERIELDDSFLNNMNNFSFATDINKDGFAKVGVGGESFWIADCTKEGDKITGVIDNALICTGTGHGLALGDTVSFLPTD